MAVPGATAIWLPGEDAADTTPAAAPTAAPTPAPSPPSMMPPMPAPSAAPPRTFRPAFYASPANFCGSVDIGTTRPPTSMSVSSRVSEGLPPRPVPEPAATTRP